VILLKLKNLIYICIGAVLIIACVGLIYSSLDNGSGIVENSSKINNTSSVNSSGVNGTENNTNNSTNEISPVINIKSSNSSEKKDRPKNTPKNSKLSYSEVSSIAKSYTAVDGTSDGFYLKYNGYIYDKGELYWKFNIYSKKNNEFLGGIRISDATGEIDLG